jgi:outer membrane beta-barrel protein
MNIYSRRLVFPLLLALGACSTPGPESADAGMTYTPSDPVIEPELERRAPVRPDIDTEDWDVGAYAGALAIEDFGTEFLYGGRIAYHVSEDFFLEGHYARADVDDDNFRRLGAPLFESSEEELSTWGLSVGYQMLPGEVFMGSRWARTSTTYLQFGAGNTDFAGEDSVTYLLGFGLRVLPADWLSLRLDARDHIFESDLTGDNEWKHNFELSVGVGVFF